jgi:hypothetical protein
LKSKAIKSYEYSNFKQINRRFSLLPLEDKVYAIDIIKKQLIEAKRDAIAKRTKEAMANLKKRRTKSGTVKELNRDTERGK